MLHWLVLGYFTILHELVNPRRYHIADCRCVLFYTSWQASVNNFHPCSTEGSDGPVVWRWRDGSYVLPLHVLADPWWRYFFSSLKRLFGTIMQIQLYVCSATFSVYLDWWWHNLAVVWIAFGCGLVRETISWFIEVWANRNARRYQDPYPAGVDCGRGVDTRTAIFITRSSWSKSV